MAEPKVLSIKGIDFNVAQPYEAGHTITEAEAKALNQTRKENLGNNFRGAVSKAQEEAEKDPSKPVDEAALQAAFAKLDAEYVFTLSNATSTRKLEPWEREARNLIKGAIREQLAAETPPKKLSDLEDDEVEKIIEANMSNPDIIKIAKKTVADRQKVAGFTLASAPAGAEPVVEQGGDQPSA